MECYYPVSSVSEVQLRMNPPNSSYLITVPYTDSILMLQNWALQLIGWAGEGALHTSMAWKVLWLCMFFTLPSFHFFWLLQNRSLWEDTFFLAYYPSFYLKLDLMKFLNDSSIPLSYLYLCNSGRYFLSIFPGLLLYQSLKEGKRVDLFTHLSMI